MLRFSANFGGGFHAPIHFCDPIPLSRPRRSHCLRTDHRRHRRPRHGRAGRRSARRDGRGHQPGIPGDAHERHGRHRDLPPRPAAARRLQGDDEPAGVREARVHGHGGPRQDVDERREAAALGDRGAHRDGDGAAVDQESAAIGNNIDNRQIKSLPTGRNYSSIVQITAGVSQQTANTAAFANTIVINGSTGLENGFVIDGVNTTGVEYGAQGKDLNYEFIQEVEVKTGGYQAEFGRSTGGIVNVITKSGGNEFHGEAFVYYNNNSVQASNKHPEDSELFSFISGYNRLDYGADLGGFALKDTLWFFGAYDRVQNTTKQTVTDGPLTGQPANTDSHTTSARRS